MSRKLEESFVEESIESFDLSKQSVRFDRPAEVLLYIFK